MQKLPQKIGFNGRPFCQEGMRGLSRHTLELIVNLKLLHPELQVFVYANGTVSKFYKDRLPFVTFRERMVRPKLLWDLWYLPRDVEADGLDLFHTTNNLGVPFGWGRGLPCFVTIHDHFTHEARIGWGRSLKDWWSSLNYRLELQLLKRARAFFTVSESAGEEIIRRLRLPAVDLVVAYNGTNLVPSPSPVRREKFFLYVGGLEERKNIETLLEAFRRYQSETKESVSLLLVGNLQSASTEVQALLRSLGESVRLLQGIGDEELAGLYQSAEALIFPSLEEGFGLPLVEAMALGCPVIASDIKVFEELARGVALFFPVRSPEALKELMVKLAAEPELRRQMIEAGRLRSQAFTWQKMAEKVYSTYLRVL